MTETGWGGETTTEDSGAPVTAHAYVLFADYRLIRLYRLISLLSPRCTVYINCTFATLATVHTLDFFQRTINRLVMFATARTPRMAATFTGVVRQQNIG